MAILTAGLAGLLIAALAALLVPVYVRARGAVNETRSHARISASWGAGALVARASHGDGLSVHVLGVSVYRGPLMGDPTPQPTARSQRRWSTPNVRPRAMWRIARRVIRSLRLRAALRGHLGTGDPADTATVFAAIAAARGLTPTLDVRALNVDWVEPVVDLEGEVSGRIWPAALAWIVLTETVGSR